VKLYFPKHVLFSSLLLLVVGCGPGSGPGATAVEMFKKVCASNDYNAMLDYVAPESSALLAMGLNFAKMDGKAANEKPICKQEIKVVSEQISGDTAVVTISGDGDPTNWKKIDGKWKLYVKK
jgi:hypothetical protein